MAIPAPRAVGRHGARPAKAIPVVKPVGAELTGHGTPCCRKGCVLALPRPARNSDRRLGGRLPHGRLGRRLQDTALSVVVRVVSRLEEAVLVGVGGRGAGRGRVAVAWDGGGGDDREDAQQARRAGREGKREVSEPLEAQVTLNGRVDAWGAHALKPTRTTLETPESGDQFPRCAARWGA